MQDLNKESKRIARYRSRMESVDKWMSKRSLPKGLRMRIGQYYQEARTLYSTTALRSTTLFHVHGSVAVFCQLHSWVAQSLALYPGCPARVLSKHTC